MRTTSRRNTERGSAIVEFTLVGSFILFPILAGLASVGMTMVTAIQVANLNANAGQMFAAGVDFTQAGNVSMLTQRMAENLNVSAGGNTEIILSQVTGTGGGTSSPVQLTLGNTALGASKYVSGGAVTPLFTMTLADGQSAYIAETYYNNPVFAWVFAPAGTGSGIYIKAIF